MTPHPGRDRLDDDLAGWMAEAYPPAYRTAYLILRNRSDAEEAVQDAFLRAWRFRSTLRERGALDGWLYRVVVNACCSTLRRPARRHETLADHGGFGALPIPSRAPTSRPATPTGPVACSPCSIPCPRASAFR